MLDHKNKAMEYLARGEKEKALEAFALCIASKPDDFDALHLSGVLSFELGHEARGLALMETALKQGTSPYIFNNYGNMLLHVGRQREAEQCYAQALELSPDYAEAHSNYGNVLLHRQLFAAAINAYDHALTLKPDLADAWANRANAHYQLKNYNSALVDLKQAFLLNANNANYHCVYADVCMDLQQYEEAQQLLLAALQINPNSYPALTGFGRLQMRMGQHEKAVQSFLAAIALDPLNSATYKSCAIACYHLGDVDSSQNMMREALKLASENPELRWLDCFMHIPARIENAEEGLAVRHQFRERLDRFQRLPDRAALPAECIGNVGPFYLLYHGVNDNEVYEQYGAVCTELLPGKCRHL